MRQDRIDDGLLTLDLLHHGLVLAVSHLVAFGDGGWFVNKAQIIRVVLGLFSHVVAEDVFLVEGTCPPLRDSVLNFVLHSDFIWRPCQCLRQRLLMQLIKLVVELGDHVLNAGGFFLLVQLVVDGVFNVFVCVLTLGLLS